MRKRRKFKRVHLIYYLLVFDNNTYQLIGHVVDVTTSGIKLMSRVPIEEGNTYQLKMVLPEGVQDMSKEIIFTSKCVWCKNNMYSDFYGNGLRFEDVSEKDIDTLKRLIDQFGYVE